MRSKTRGVCETGSPAPSPAIYVLFEAINIRRSWEPASIAKASFLAVFLNLNKSALHSGLHGANEHGNLKERRTTEHPLPSLKASQYLPLEQPRANASLCLVTPLPHQLFCLHEGPVLCWRWQSFHAHLALSNNLVVEVLFIEVMLIPPLSMACVEPRGWDGYIWQQYRLKDAVASLVLQWSQAAKPTGFSH